jgi:hypothetical protein
LYFISICHAHAQNGVEITIIIIIFQNTAIEFDKVFHLKPKSCLHVDVVFQDKWLFSSADNKVSRGCKIVGGGVGEHS